MSTAFRHSCPLPSSSMAPPSARARSCFPVRPIWAETEPFTKALTLSVSWELPLLSEGNSCAHHSGWTIQEANLILTRSRHTILPKSTTLTSRGASRFRALRSGTIQESSVYPHTQLVGLVTCAHFETRRFKSSGRQSPSTQLRLVPSWPSVSNAGSNCLPSRISDYSFLSGPPARRVTSVTFLEQPHAYSVRLGSKQHELPCQVCPEVT